jgi:sugar phosphate isomerase/epimerase
MAVQMPPRPRQPDRPDDGQGVGPRLGIDLPTGWWPTAARLKAIEAAGFQLLQVRMPRSVLAEEPLLVAHAAAVRDSLRLTGLRLVLHAPDDLVAGTAQDDARLDAALRYAARSGSELLVYHGAQVAGTSSAVAGEVRSLRAASARAAELGVGIAVENLAPVYPGAAHACRDLTAIADLVRAVDSPQLGICLDLGHAHIAAGLADRSALELIGPVLPHAILWEVHDNFGARWDTPRAGGIEPLRLDLHLPPGAGTVPWRALAPLIAGHAAPVILEIHPAKRPELATLAVLMRELLGVGGTGPASPSVPTNARRLPVRSRDLRAE